jgi:hypothetical protein
MISVHVLVLIIIHQEALKPLLLLQQQALKLI